MNIFILDTDLIMNAKYHVDKHVTKMLVEYTQLLSSAYYFTNEEGKAPYKKTHVNHPCAVWVRQSLDNWLWLRDLAVELYVEYQYRYNGKEHKSGEVVLDMDVPDLPSKGRSAFAITTFKDGRHKDYCFKVDDEKAVDLYREYYKIDKVHMHSWSGGKHGKGRGIPYWIG